MNWLESKEQSLQWWHWSKPWWHRKNWWSWCQWRPWIWGSSLLVRLCPHFVALVSDIQHWRQHNGVTQFMTLMWRIHSAPDHSHVSRWLVCGHNVFFGITSHCFQPYSTFPFILICSSLESMLSRPEMVDLCSSWKRMGQCWFGTSLRQLWWSCLERIIRTIPCFQSWHPFIMLSYQCGLHIFPLFQPFKHTQYSVEALYLCVDFAKIPKN